MCLFWEGQFGSLVRHAPSKTMKLTAIASTARVKPTMYEADIALSHRCIVSFLFGRGRMPCRDLWNIVCKLVVQKWSTSAHKALEEI